MTAIENWPIVLEGVWLYASSINVAVRILLSNENWGTGDYEDNETIRENQNNQCYFIAYESAGSPGVFNNLIPNFTTLESALDYAEGKFPSIRWGCRSESESNTPNPSLGTFPSCQAKPS